MQKRRSRDLRRIAWSFLVLIFSGAATIAAAEPAASPWAETKQTQIRLMAAHDAVGEGSAVLLGLQIRLQPGWKIYWRSPGDAGIPPRFDWSGSGNLAAAAVQWPVPHRFRLYDLDTFGYTDAVVLPIEAHLAQPGAPLTLRLKLSYGICREVCIPYDTTLALDLPAGAGADSAFAPLIARYAALVPRQNDGGGFRIEAASLIEEAGGRVLAVTARSDQPFHAPDLLLEGPAGLTFAAPKISIGPTGEEAVFRSAVNGPKSIALAGNAVTVTMVDGAQAVERQLQVAR